MVIPDSRKKAKKDESFRLPLIYSFVLVQSTPQQRERKKRHKVLVAAVVVVVVES
jgi:hypothetical protein